MTTSIGQKLNNDPPTKTKKLNKIETFPIMFKWTKREREKSVLLIKIKFYPRNESKFIVTAVFTLCHIHRSDTMAFRPTHFNSNQWIGNQKCDQRLKKIIKIHTHDTRIRKHEIYGKFKINAPTNTTQTFMFRLTDLAQIVFFSRFFSWTSNKTASFVRNEHVKCCVLIVFFRNVVELWVTYYLFWIL